MSDPLGRVCSYAELRRVTLALAAEAGVAVVVRAMPAGWERDRWGCVRRWTIFYARSAPLWVVAHELAHVVTPADEPEHGARWALNAATIGQHLLEEFLGITALAAIVADWDHVQ